MPESAAPSSHTLSEYESKKRLSALGVPIAPEKLVSTPAQAATAAREIGTPVVVKLCGERIAHKTERNLVRLGVADERAAEAAAEELLGLPAPKMGRSMFWSPRWSPGRES